MRKKIQRMVGISVATGLLIAPLTACNNSGEDECEAFATSSSDQVVLAASGNLVTKGKGGGGRGGSSGGRGGSRGGSSGGHGSGGSHYHHGGHVDFDDDCDDD